MSESKRTKHWTAGIAALLGLVGSQASGCGPSFSSCEATRTCATSNGGSAEIGGAGGDTIKGAGADNGLAGPTSGGANSDGGMSDNGGDAGRNAAGAISDGAAPDDIGAGGKAGGQSAITGGAAGSSGASATGGGGLAGGASDSSGSPGEAGAGASGQTECKAGYTVLCGDLYGSTGCAKKRLYCLGDGSWPTESTGCAPSNRDCASLDDNDCDGRADNTLDETCTCTDLGVPVAGQTVCLKYSPDENLSNLCCQCDSKNGVFVLAKKSNTTYTCVVP
jgi:hypothetical protein